jgi:hypothetical protein
VPERQQFVRINRIDERPQIIVAMSAPTSGTGYGGSTKLRSGPRPLGDESGPDFTTLQSSRPINISRPNRRHHAAPFLLAALMAASGSGCQRLTPRSSIWRRRCAASWFPLLFIRQGGRSHGFRWRFLHWQA